MLKRTLQDFRKAEPFTFLPRMTEYHQGLLLKNSFWAHFCKPRDLFVTRVSPRAYKYHPCTIILTYIVKNKICRNHLIDDLTKYTWAPGKLTRWLFQVSMRHIAFCSLWFSGMLIRLLGQEMPLPGDLDTRIDTPKWKHTICNKSSLCVEKIRLQSLYSCKPPLAQKLLFLFYSEIEKKWGFKSDIF